MQWLKRLRQRPHRFEIHPRALNAEACQQVTQQLLQSPYLQANVLNERFASTQGFSIIFQNAQDVLALFSELAPALSALRLDPACNLYYLNVLVLETSAKVERHIDHSIRGYQQTLPYPLGVSVLYLQISDMQGGQLLLFDKQDQIAQKIVPQTGLQLRFPGHMKHAVEAVAKSKTPRVSLVCEQYSLSSKELSYVPEFTLKSRADFKSFLKQNS